MVKKIKRPKEATLTAGTFIAILISAFSFAALTIILQYKEEIVALPLPLEFLVFVAIYVFAALLAIGLGIFIIKGYNKTRKAFG